MLAFPGKAGVRSLSLAVMLTLLVVFGAGPALGASLWPVSAVPVVADGGSSSAMELGVKFRSDTAGTISGIRFYKAPGNTGTHVANLWTSSGERLATATFTNESPSGWQQVNFATPVAISANTVYVASYHTNVGHYSEDQNYFAGKGVDSPPLHALADGVSGANGVRARGASKFPSGAWRSSNFWVDVVFNVSTVDTTPPSVTAFTLPIATSSLNVPISSFTAQDDVAVTGYLVTESAAAPLASDTGWSASTPTSYTFATAGSKTLYAWAKDAAGNVSASRSASVTITLADTTAPSVTAFAIPATSSALNVPISSFTAQDNVAVTGYLLTESSTAPSANATGWSSTAPVSYTFATAGAKTLYAWAKDAAGNVSASRSATVTITLVQAATSLWPATAVPTVADSGPDSAVEIGVRFRSDTAGTITGIRFYKGIGNTGTHVGNLWSSSGTRLATATFTSESASGWQQVDFVTPVSISANTVYIASYHTNTGHYSADEYFFSGKGVDNPPLHAPADGSAGANGVYVYGTGSAFPNLGWHSANYWVDVVFMPSGASDTIPPTVTAFTIPATADTLTVPVSSFTAQDNVAVSGYLLTESATVPSAGASGWSASAPTSYTFATAGTKTLYAWAKDAAGNVSASRSASVTINLLQSGPPVLLVTSTANPFSAYYSEIMRAEGLNLFATSDIAAVTSSTLSAFDTVVLGEMPLTASQVTMLSNWVDAGGQLIAMRPDKKLAPLLGLADQGSTISNAYLLVNTSSAPGSGIVNQTMQYHGAADLYSLNGASNLATLYANAGTATSSPAVSIRAVGNNGGQAAAFSYDLARSIVYTRQGNPLWAGQERDGYPPVRSDDQFYGNASFDPQPDWIDLNKVRIPQADEQQRLLANLIIRMGAAHKPLPRFWYFPRNLAAVVVMTGDDHAHGGTVGRFDQYASLSPSGCSVDNWECIRGTSYIYTDTPISNSQASAYNSAGFEVALHVTTNCGDYTPTTLRSFYTTQLDAWHSKYTSLPGPVTNRTHCIAWSDYATQPLVERENGIRLDTNYYYWPQEWMANAPGFFTGSGVPMRFANADGSRIDVYQAPTQMTDESGQAYPYTIDTLLDLALNQGYYGAFVANAHTDLATTPESDAIIASARARNVPVITARQLLEWVDGRNNSSFSSITWNGSSLSFSVSAGQGARGLVAMVPVPTGQNVSRVLQNGSAIASEIVTIKGIRYVRFLTTSAAYSVEFSGTSDTSAPTVTAFSIPSSASALTVPITAFTAQDNVAVSGYLLSETASTPAATAAGWSTTVPSSYTFATAGAKTLYAWAKDAAGNVSASRSASVTITLADTTPPSVTAFTIPATSASLTVSVTSFTAQDNVAVTGYLINESATAPAASAAGWLAAPPVSYTAASAGAKTLYAWAKDAAGNVSASRSATVTITLVSTGPEPVGWYAGDMHVHRSCGGTPEALTSFPQKMASNNLAVVSMRADMGNGEVQGATQDLPRVNGQDDPLSSPGRILHWEAEWHWDPTLTQYPFQALGGHVVPLGLLEAHQIQEEYTKPIFDWAHQQNAIAGFAHMQYLKNDIPQTLDCCTPLEYPVEVALGTADFVSEDVDQVGSNQPMCPDCGMQAYYRLLNCGFRPGLAAGTDYPCNDGAALGSLLTYVQVPNGQMTYANWVDGIAKGRTVISRNGHNEFLDLKVNGSAMPGDEIKMSGGGSVTVSVTWTANQAYSGTIELVHNGVVVASQQGSVTSSRSAVLTATVNFSKSGWLAARRMGSDGHQVHTAAVFVTVDNLPVRASAADADFFIQWTDNLLSKTSPGGAWSSYFSTERTAAQARYSAARDAYRQISAEAAAGAGNAPGSIFTTQVPTLFENDAAYELGTRFWSDAAGQITQVRIYTNASEGGSHTVRIWRAGNSSVAAGPFTWNITAGSQGWKTFTLPSPLSITANTDYIVAVSNSGDRYYAEADHGFDAPIVNGHLHTYVGSGVYSTVNGSMPTSTWQNSSYFRDVVFVPQ